MNNVKKKLAAKILNTSPEKIHFQPEALPDIKKAITRGDIRGLIAVGKISLRHLPEQSRSRARKNAEQKRKGRRSGRGSRKGRKFSRVDEKTRWIQSIRLQRAFLQLLKEKELLSNLNFRKLYMMSKGGYFRNKRHIKLYLSEHHLIENKAGKAGSDLLNDTKVSGEHKHGQ
ncbi:50S ribosomal protein L19e [Candidatus Woesearchaeota archaeon]|nr:50S ribosomal protein L19e [Candidatus Woesearchaeota archaeon]